MPTSLFLITLLFTFSPSSFASKSPNAEAEIINLTMQQSAQGSPDPKLGADGQQTDQQQDANGGVEPIRLVNLPFKGREKIIGGAQRDRLLGRLSRLEPSSTTAGAGVRQLLDPLDDGTSTLDRFNAAPNSLPSAGLGRILSVAGNRISPSASPLLGFGTNSPFSPAQLASFLRQSRNTGNDQQNPNLTGLQSIQREQQRVLQQQQQLALQLAIQQRAQRVQQQLLASQKGGNDGRTFDVPNISNNIFPSLNGRFGRNSPSNVQIQRPTNSNALNALANLLGGTGQSSALNGQSPLISSRLALDGQQQDFGPLLQSLRQNGPSPNSLASLLNGQSSNPPLDSSSLANLISTLQQPNSFKFVSDDQQKALQQILDQEQRILDLLNNRRDLQTVQEQQQRILALLNQQQGAELAKTILTGQTPSQQIGGLFNNGFGANVGQQPNLLGRILNVGQPQSTTAIGGFVPTSSASDIQQQPIFFSPQQNGGAQFPLGGTPTLDLGQLLQQQISSSSIGQQPQLLQIPQGSTIFGTQNGGIPLQSQNSLLGQDGTNGGIIGSPASNLGNLLQIQQQIDNDGQFPTSSLALADPNSNSADAAAAALMFFQRGQPKTGIQPEEQKGGEEREKPEENEEKDGEEEEKEEENSEEEEEEEEKMK